jgi:hypothetical protein
MPAEPAFDSDWWAKINESQLLIKILDAKG